MSQATQHVSTSLNGFDLAAMGDIVEQVTSDPGSAVAAFRVRSQWAGGARVESRVTEYELGGQRIARSHVVVSDEPRELFGADSAPNPQELLFVALNGCLLFSYAAKAAAAGIEVTRLSVETHGQLDIRGALGTAPVPPGMVVIHATVRIRANTTDAALEELHQAVAAHSPNLFHLTQPIEVRPQLVIDR